MSLLRGNLSANEHETSDPLSLFLTSWDMAKTCSVHVFLSVTSAENDRHDPTARRVGLTPALLNSTVCDGQHQPDGG